MPLPEVPLYRVISDMSAPAASEILRPRPATASNIFNTPTSPWVLNLSSDNPVYDPAPAFHHTTPSNYPPLTSNPSLRTSLGGIIHEELVSRLQQPMPPSSYSTRVHGFTGNIFTRDERLTPTTRLFGIELEVIPISRPRNEVSFDILWSMPGMCMTKEDSSIGEHGFEIVSAPATLAAHRLMWLPFFYKDGAWEDWHKLLKAPRSHRATGIAKSLKSYKAETCGMHIHISAKSFTLPTLHKFWNFMNAAVLDPYLSRIAGRSISRNHYCHQHHISFRAAIERFTDRYAALNLQATPDTVEVRIFRGNTNPLGFMKNLDFVDAAITFCDQASLRSIGGREFLGFVDSNRSKWPFFNAWLGSRLRGSPHHYLMDHSGPKQRKLPL